MWSHAMHRGVYMAGKIAAIYKEQFYHVEYRGDRISGSVSVFDDMAHRLIPTFGGHADADRLVL